MKCERCKNRSTRKHLEEHEGLCPRCFRFSQMPAYDEAVLEREVIEWRKDGRAWSWITAEAKKLMQPPNGKYWIDLDIVMLGVRHLNWGTT